MKGGGAVTETRLRDLVSAWEEQASSRYAVTEQLSDTARGIVAAEAETLIRCAAQLRELTGGIRP